MDLNGGGVNETAQVPRGKNRSGMRTTTTAASIQSCRVNRGCITGNYSCYDGGGCGGNDTTWALYKAVLDTVTVALLSPSCLPAVFNHPYFHISHAIMFICYMLPFGSPCKLILLVRIGLAGATTVMALLARNVQCWVDGLLWNAASAVVNVIYVIVLFYQLRPIKFNDELEQVLNLKIFN